MRPMLATLALLFSALAVAGAPAKASPQVCLQTVDGKIIVELYPDKAPKTVANFLRYVREGHYDNTIFHRVVPGFVIQGGGYTPKYEEKPTHDPIKNEAGNGLSNQRGTIAMAREFRPDTAKSQFYINLADNSKLDATDYRDGYAVFGRVIRGMTVVDRIAEIPTGPGGPFKRDVPQRPAIVEKAYVLDQPVKPEPVPPAPGEQTGKPDKQDQD